MSWTLRVQWFDHTDQRVRRVPILAGDWLWEAVVRRVLKMSAQLLQLCRRTLEPTASGHRCVGGSRGEALFL